MCKVYVTIQGLRRRKEVLPSEGRDGGTFYQYRARGAVDPECRAKDKHGEAPRGGRLVGMVGRLGKRCSRE